MADSDKKKTLWDDFKEGFKEGYEGTDENDSEKSTKQKVVDGAVKGTTETVFNPIKWLFSIFN